MKYFKIIIIGLLTTLFSCNKIERMKNKINPSSPYKEAEIDRFYWEDSGSDYDLIPITKPFQLIRIHGNNEWDLFTGFNNHDEVGVSNILFFNTSSIYIYGYKPFEKDEKDSDFDSPEKWFIMNTQAKKISFFEKESEFKAELKKLNLPETFLNPDEVYEEFKQNPVLSWFPEDIKKQLKDVEEKKNKNIDVSYLSQENVIDFDFNNISNPNYDRKSFF